MKKKREMHPRVSIIIPTKNEGSCLDACLKSLQKQKTIYPYEVIVVDTNSTDSTLSIAKKYKVTILHEPLPGRNIARKTGTEHAKGDIFCFTEADCIVPEDWIEKITREFDANPNVVGVVGRYMFHNISSYETLRKIFMPLADYTFRILHGHIPFRASNAAITRKAILSVGGYDTKTREFDDVELSMRVSKIGAISYMPELYIKTGDRRIKGRLFKYLLEGLGNYYKTCILKQSITEQTYADIR